MQMRVNQDRAREISLSHIQEGNIGNSDNWHSTSPKRYKNRCWSRRHPVLTGIALFGCLIMEGSQGSLEVEPGWMES